MLRSAYLAAFFLVLVTSSFNVFAASSKPNIVLLLADDLGFTDLGAYGSEISTPHIDSLAERGRLFNNYHTASSCAPTRAMLMSGLSSHKAGLGNMPESLTPEMRGSPEYTGHLRTELTTIADQLKANGYKTYIAGKWHLGKTKETLPSARGFDRTFVLGDTGADNWEQKPYLPIYDKGNWYADGQETTLPNDFYSSKTLIDKTIEFIDGDSHSNQPFFAYVAFQAVHIPVQAPREFTDKYLTTYTDGWHELRKRRYQGAIEKGVMPAGLPLEQMASTTDWHSLTAEEQQYEAKSMAVYAGMVEAMDHHVGRLINHLKETGEYDNTVFVFTSDNGAEPSDTLSKETPALAKRYFRWWMDGSGYNTNYETLGEKGSYVMIGASFASAAVSPLSFYKFFNGEGGMRVPLIISGPVTKLEQPASDAFSFVTDLAPTILEVANANPLPNNEGVSLLPILSGEKTTLRDSDEGVGFELGGNGAFFLGDYKLVRNRGDIGKNEWRLYNIKEDPTESFELSKSEPQKFQQLMAGYQNFAEKHGVLEMPEGYDQRAQIALNQVRLALRTGVPYLMGGIIVFVCLVIFLVRVWRSRSAT